MKKVAIDKLGRMVIPVSIRRSLDLQEGSELDVSLDNDRIILCRSSSLCKICYTKITIANEFCVCERCIRKIKNSDIQF